MKNQLATEWQKILSMNDWTICVEEDCSPNNMVLKDVAGESEWTESTKTAVIRIIAEKDYGDRIKPFDKEQILVHELLHLKLCLLGESGNEFQDRYLHQIIDELATAFVRAKRQKRGWL